MICIAITDQSLSKISVSSMEHIDWISWLPCPTWTDTKQFLGPDNYYFSNRVKTALCWTDCHWIFMCNHWLEKIKIYVCVCSCVRTLKIFNNCKKAIVKLWIITCFHLYNRVLHGRIDKHCLRLIVVLNDVPELSLIILYNSCVCTITQMTWKPIFIHLMFEAFIHVIQFLYIKHL